MLAGLSSAQHKWYVHSTNSVGNLSGSLTAPYMWASEKYAAVDQIYDEVDRIKTSHPVFVIPEGVAERTRAYFADKGGF